MDLVILIAAAIFVIFLWPVAVYAEDSASFRDRFPPITEDEFMARCRPGRDRTVALRVRRIVSEQTGVPYERVDPSMRFVDDLRMD